MLAPPPSPQFSLGSGRVDKEASHSHINGRRVELRSGPVTANDVANDGGAMLDPRIAKRVPFVTDAKSEA